MTGRRAAALTAAYYALVFATLGAYVPYWPVWFEAWGLDRADIGFFLGAATVTRIAGSTIITAIADRYAIRRRMIAITSAATSAVLLAHLVVETAGLLLAATLILAAVMAPSIPLGEALGLRAAAIYGFAYAPARAAGSVGFLVANVAVGWALDRYHPDLVIWIVAPSFLLLAVLGSVHPGGGSAAATDRARYSEAVRLMATPAFAVFALALALTQSSHVVFYVYSVLAWQDQGLSGTTIGWLWAIGVVAETVLMLGPGRRIVDAIGPAAAIAVGAAAAMLRWAAMAAEPGALWLWPLQGLHALTFAVTHLGAMAFLARAVPARLAASAQGLVSGLAMGAVSALAMAVAAGIVEHAGIASAYSLASAMALASLIAALMLGRLWTGQSLAD